MQIPHATTEWTSAVISWTQSLNPEYFHHHRKDALRYLTVGAMVNVAIGRLQSSCLCMQSPKLSNNSTSSTFTSGLFSTWTNSLINRFIAKSSSYQTYSIIMDIILEGCNYPAGCSWNWTKSTIWIKGFQLHLLECLSPCVKFRDIGYTT